MLTPIEEAPAETFVPQPTQVLISVSPSAIRARDPSLPEETQRHLLAMQYRAVTIQDAYRGGNAYFNTTTQSWWLLTKRPEASFKGLVFEAALARLCKEDPFNIGRKAFAWCTNKSLGRVSNETISQYTPLITADPSLLNDPLTASFFNPQSVFDFHFYKINSQGSAEIATQVGTAVQAGIQVKAIRGGERQEIIDPIRSGRYHHVLTMLEHPSGIHSYEVCTRILRAMVTNGEIDGEMFAHILGRITYPSNLGISQEYINDYSEYISQIYSAGGAATADMSAAIGLEVTQSFVESAGGILIPDNTLVTPTTIQ